MTPRRAAVVVLAAVAAFAAVARAEYFDAALTRLQLEQRFSEVRAAKKLRVDKPLRWEYRFSSSDLKALEDLSVQLAAENYKIVTLHAPRAGEPAATLHVMRVEQHTPASLLQRGEELGRRAMEHGATYDGVDAG